MKLTKTHIEQIKALSSTGMIKVNIAATIGCSLATVANILNNKYNGRSFEIQDLHKTRLEKTKQIIIENPGLGKEKLNPIIQRELGVGFSSARSYLKELGEFARLMTP